MKYDSDNLPIFGSDETVISRAEAHDLGMSHYYPGGPCKNGHMSEFHVKRNTCRECERLDTQRRRAAKRERI